MKIKIDYKFLADRDPCFWATSILEGGTEIWTCGGSWDQARERHIERLKKYANPVYPPTYEEVEI